MASQAQTITAKVRELFYDRVWSTLAGVPPIWQDNVNRPDFPASQTWCRFVVLHGTEDHALLLDCRRQGGCRRDRGHLPGQDNRHEHDNNKANQNSELHLT